MGERMDDPPQQAGAIPYRRSRGQLQFCLITSMGDSEWIFPKGIIDPGDSAVQTAIQEAVEEAGVRGRVRPDPVGRYAYLWHERIELTVEVYLLAVDRVDGSWDEMGYRSRRWCTVDEALRLLEHHPGLDVFRRAVSMLADPAGP